MWNVLSLMRLYLYVECIVIDETLYVECIVIDETISVCGMYCH